MIKNLKECLNNVIDEEKINKTLIFTQVLELYIEDNKKRIRDNAIANIKRVEIYNRVVEVNACKEKLALVGDYVYIAVRKNFDCYADKHHSISKRAFDWALNDSLELRKLEVLDNEYYVNSKGKKVKRKDVIRELKNCIDSVYNVSEKNYILGLN